MKISKENLELLTTLFAHHPEVDVFYICADDAAFTEAHNADSHAQRLKDDKVLTVTRDAFELGETVLLTERAQEAPEGKIKGVDTIPSEVIDLQDGGSKDAATALTNESKETKDSLIDTDSENKIDGDKAASDAAKEQVKTEQTDEQKASDAAKAEKETVTAEYIEVLGKRPGVQYNVAKMKELIAAKKAESTDAEGAK